VFFGVPNQGLETRPLQTLLSVVRNQPNATLVNLLGKDSDFLTEQRRSFLEAYSKKDFPNTEIFCYYETKETPSLEMVSICEQLSLFLY
jgi:hypothetical protein